VHFTDLNAGRYKICTVALKYSSRATSLLTVVIEIDICKAQSIAKCVAVKYIGTIRHF
jgi:hypothetical protein